MSPPPITDHFADVSICRILRPRRRRLVGTRALDHIHPNDRYDVCISNRTVTRTVVDGLEQRGIPAFGPIWDS